MILIATDAWEPQVNGVVTTLKKIQELDKEVIFLTPNDFKNFYNPIYPEIRLAFPSQKEISSIISNINPSHIHISTEGPIGWAVRKWCINNKFKFSTSYHTKFPEFLNSLCGIPVWMTYWIFKKFHNAGQGMFVSTPSLAKDLKKIGFKNIIPWSRGVDTKLFYPLKRKPTKTLLYVGRVSKEKNIEAFLNIDMPEYKKIVVGDGPELESMKRKYPNVQFEGLQKGVKLAYWYKVCDVFVFPSKSDTFGLVMLESLACGTPVAAYPVTGPIDIIKPNVGCLNEDLKLAVEQALLCDRKVCRNYAEEFSWHNTVKTFIKEVKNV